MTNDLEQRLNDLNRRFKKLSMYLRIGRTKHPRDYVSMAMQFKEKIRQHHSGGWMATNKIFAAYGRLPHFVKLIEDQQTEIHRMKDRIAELEGGE